MFVDCFNANMLMDVFVREKEYEEASLVAHEVMLQEMGDRSIA